MFKGIGQFFINLFSSVKKLKDKADSAADTLLKKLDQLDELLDEGNIDKIRELSSDIRTYVEWFKNIL